MYIFEKGMMIIHHLSTNGCLISHYSNVAACSERLSTRSYRFCVSDLLKFNNSPSFSAYLYCAKAQCIMLTSIPTDGTDFEKESA